MVEKKQLKSLERLEKLLELLIEQLMIDMPGEAICPIPTKTLIEMEEIIAENISLIGLT